MNTKSIFEKPLRRATSAAVAVEAAVREADIHTHMTTTEDMPITTAVMAQEIITETGVADSEADTEGGKWRAERGDRLGEILTENMK